MEFDKGMAGVALVVLSLIASAILGVVLNVDKTVVQRDTPIYQSDITGLFNASTQKSYIDYDVSANYNGYSWHDDTAYPVNFKPSTTANNYPFDRYDTSIKYNTDTLKNIAGSKIVETAGSAYRFFKAVQNVTYTGDYENRYSINLTLWAGEEDGQSVYYIPLDKLYDILYEDATKDGVTNQLETISFGSTGIVSLRTLSYSAPPPMILSNSISVYETNMGAYVLPKNYFELNSTDKKTVSSGLYPYSHLETVGDNGSISYTCTYISKNNFYLSINGSNGLNDTPLSNSSTSEYIVVFAPIHTWGTIQYHKASSTADIYYNSEIYPTYKETITTAYEYDRHRDYLDPRYGVANLSGDTTPITWKNGYQNGSFDIVINASQYITDTSSENYNEVIVNQNAYYNNQWDLYYGQNENGTLTDYKISIRASQTPNGPIYITLLTTSGGTETIQNQVNIGIGWVGASVHIDSVNGTVSVTPIAPSEWATFLTWSTVQQPIMIGKIPIGDIYGFKVFNNTSYNSFRFQVSNTSVFLNTYGVIMINPSVNIVNWYPNNTKFMISFTKTASTGETITIGGTEYKVKDQMITIPQDDDKYVKIDISEYNVTYIQEGDAYKITIESPKSGTSATVTSSDTTISMGGAWYFNSAYYTVEERDYQEYTWQFGELAFGLSALLMFMMIFLGILTLLTWKLLPGTLGAIDIGIIIVAEIILFIIV